MSMLSDLLKQLDYKQRTPYLNAATAAAIEDLPTDQRDYIYKAAAGLMERIPGLGVTSAYELLIALYCRPLQREVFITPGVEE